MDGVWQLPQGGIEQGESPEAAMWRELQEEIGTKDVEVIGALPDSIRYDWPEDHHGRGYLGQEQRYFLVRLKKDAEINLAADSCEFDQCCWMGAGEFLSKLSSFKADAYKKAIEKLQYLVTVPTRIPVSWVNYFQLVNGS